MLVKCCLSKLPSWLHEGAAHMLAKPQSTSLSCKQPAANTLAAIQKSTACVARSVAGAQALTMGSSTAEGMPRTIEHVYAGILTAPRLQHLTPQPVQQHPSPVHHTCPHTAEAPASDTANHDFAEAYECKAPACATQIEKMHAPACARA